MDSEYIPMIVFCERVLIKDVLQLRARATSGIEQGGMITSHYLILRRPFWQNMIALNQSSIPSLLIPILTRLLELESGLHTPGTLVPLSLHTPALLFNPLVSLMVVVFLSLSIADYRRKYTIRF